MTNVTTMSWLWSVNFKTYIVFQNLDIENFGFIGTLHHLGPVEKNIVYCYPGNLVICVWQPNNEIVLSEKQPLYVWSF